jgi:hypothetical protein
MFERMVVFVHRRIKVSVGGDLRPAPENGQCAQPDLVKGANP